MYVNHSRSHYGFYMAIITLLDDVGDIVKA